MPWQEDPSWGNIFGNLATQFNSSTNEALQQRALAEKIISERTNRAAATATAQSFARNLPQYGPTTEFNPVAPSVDESGQWSATPVMDEPANLPQTWTDPAGAQQFSDRRDLYSKLGMQTALLNRPSEIPGLLSKGIVGTTGVPDDPAAKSALEFGVNGKFREEKPQLYIAVGPDGTRRAAFTSIDGKTDQFTGKPIVGPPGTTIVPANQSEANPQPINPFKDGGSKVIVNNAMNDVGNNRRLDPDAARTAAFALSDMGYSPKTKFETDTAGRKTAVHGYMENEIPPALQPLVRHLNEVLFPPIGAAPQAAPQPAPGPVPPVGATRSTDPLAATAPAAPPAPQVSPTSIIPPMTTEVLSQGPSTGEQTKEVRAVAQATAARQMLEKLMYTDPATGQQRDKPYVPGLMAAVANEKFGGSVAGRYAVGKMDPTAKAYFIAAKQWVEPVLRMASGAAIRDSEYADYYGMFIPEAGDSLAVIKQKMDAMKTWEDVTAKAATSGDALNMMQQRAAGNPMVQQAVEQIRVKARERGTLDTPLQPLRAAADTAAQTQAPGAPTAAGVDHDKVARILGLR